MVPEQNLKTLISFEVEQQARHQAGQQLRLWRVELVNHERQTEQVEDEWGPGFTQAC